MVAPAQLLFYYRRHVPPPKLYLDVRSKRNRCRLFLLFFRKRYSWMNSTCVALTRWHRNTRVTSKMRAVWCCYPKVQKPKSPAPSKSLRCIQVWSQCEIYCCLHTASDLVSTYVHDIRHRMSPSVWDYSALFIEFKSSVQLWTWLTPVDIWSLFCLTLRQNLARRTSHFATPFKRPFMKIY